MNKHYFKIGHMFLELYNDKTTSKALKYKLFEAIDEITELAQLSLIDDKGEDEFKKILLDTLYKDKNNARS